MMQTLALLILCIVLQGQSTSVSQRNHEQNTRVIIGGEEFLFGTEQVGWNDAALLCEGLGMQLATLDTEERWNMIADYMLVNTALAGNYWIGGHRQPTGSNTWYWRSTNQDFTFTAWNEGADQPDRLQEQESCLAALGRDVAGSPGLWWDFNCDMTDIIKYLCETVTAN